MGGTHRQQGSYQPCPEGRRELVGLAFAEKGQCPHKTNKGSQSTKQKPAEHSQPGSGCCCGVDRMREAKVGANPIPQLPYTEIKSKHI